MNVILFIATLLVSVSAMAAEKPLRVYLLAGQSNMDGRGDGSKLSAGETKRLVELGDRARFIYNGQEAGPLSVTVPAAHIAKKFSLETTFGPELFFGLSLAEAHPDERFLFIKRSRGGTSLYGCWNPDWSAEKAKVTDELEYPKLYQEFERDIDRALKGLDGVDYEFSGMLWVQGEADSGVKKYGPKPAETYGENLTKLVSSIREHTITPDLPFVLLEVGSPQIREASRGVAKSVENVSTIPQSADETAPNHLPGYGPPVGHYNYEGMKRIGLLFFEVFEDKYPFSREPVDSPR